MTGAAKMRDIYESILREQFTTGAASAAPTVNNWVSGMATAMGPGTLSIPSSYSIGSVSASAFLRQQRETNDWIRFQQNLLSQIRTSGVVEPIMKPERKTEPVPVPLGDLLTDMGHEPVTRALEFLK